MTELTQAQLTALAQYGFDAARLERHRAELRARRLDQSRNVVEGRLLPPPAGSIRTLPRPDSPEGERARQHGRDAIARGELGVVVLNGGMATRFGGVVKGVVPVLGEHRSFLGLKMEDVRAAEARCGGRIQVFLMNSFATGAATKAHFAQHRHFGLDPARIHHFDQFVAVRLTKEGDLALEPDGQPARYGPGHGDFAEALKRSGCLARFLASGGKHLFVSNVDNLGARVDEVVLGDHVTRGLDVTVEVAPKWKGDVGGSPYLVESARPPESPVQLVEQIRYPAGFDPEIVSVFNTNTFHFRAAALEREFPLGFYYVEKKAHGRTVVQMERLIGEMTRFLAGNFVEVERTGPRNRFFPIKTPEDLEAGRAEIRTLFG